MQDKNKNKKSATLNLPKESISLQPVAYRDTLLMFHLKRPILGN